MIGVAARVLVVTADDFGLTTATSQACIEAHRHGMVSAVSVLGNGAAVDETADLLRSAPDLSVGAHLAIVGEDPPRSPPGSVPTLVDAAGAFRPSWREVVRDAALGRIDPADVRRELDAQLTWLAEVVGPLEHVNLHQHLHLWPSIGAVTIDLARAHGIGFVRTPSSSSRGPRGIGVRRLAERLRRSCREAGLATTDGFAGLDEAGAWQGEQLRRALRSPASSMEVNLHPGATDDPERERFDWGYAWSAELQLACDADVRSTAEASGWVLAGPAALRGSPGRGPDADRPGT